MGRRLLALLVPLACALFAFPALASEANLVIPNLRDATIGPNGLWGASLLGAGIGIAAFGIVVGLIMFVQVKNCPPTKRCSTSPSSSTRRARPTSLRR
jgi:hypothetical protein